MYDPERMPSWLSRMEKNMPEAAKRFEIKVLMRLTAASFGIKGISMGGMDSGECLKAFRHFTVDAVKGQSGETLSSFRRKMYRRAFMVGRCFSILPGLRKDGNRKRLIVMLYRNIGIMLRSAEGKNDGIDIWRINIPHCSFSSDYTPEVCRVMSGLDAGIICGIFGGGKLKFIHRITEGCSYCSAVYKK